MVPCGLSPVPRLSHVKNEAPEEEAATRTRSSLAINKFSIIGKLLEDFSK